MGRTISEAAGRINGTYGEADWTPIRYVNRSYSQRALAGLYRSARVGLVTPLRDGMNLVAKEYIAAQNPEDPGVLILSRFAGAASECTLGIFLFDPRNLRHAAGLRLATQISDQCPQHTVDVDSVRLRSARSPVHLQAGRIQNVIVNAMGFQDPMQPEPVIARLVARHHLDRSVQLPSNARVNPLNQIEQRLGVACLYLVPTSLITQRCQKSHEPTRLA